MPLAAWLLSIAWPIVSRVLLSAGIGTITYTGSSAALNALLASAKASFTGLVPEVTSILAIGGAFEAMSIIAGGLVSGLVFMTLKKFALKSGT